MISSMQVSSCRVHHRSSTTSCATGDYYHAKRFHLLRPEQEARAHVCSRIVYLLPLASAAEMAWRSSLCN